MNLNFDEIIQQVADVTASKVIAYFESGGHLPDKNLEPTSKSQEAGREFMNTTEMAEYLRIAKQTAYSWRSKRKGPPYHMIEGEPRYRKSEIDAWSAERTVRPE